MGQVRSMMRQVAWSLPGTTPAQVVTSLETALTGLPLAVLGTMVHCHLTPLTDRDGWMLRHTNAGHPPPIVVSPGPSARLLTEHDALFGHSGLATRTRRDHETTVPPGSLVFLYTDGLIERRGVDLDEACQALATVLTDLADQPAQIVADGVLDRFLGSDGHDDDDDVVVLAIGT